MGWADDVDANADYVLCFSSCFVFCALIGAGDGGISHGFCVVFLKNPGGTVPTLDVSLMCI